MAGGAEHDPQQPLAEINVTPLVDVMLVLLVIFILAAPLFAQALRVDLPKAKAPSASEQLALTLTIFQDGRLQLDETEMDLPHVVRALQQVVNQDPQRVVRIAADGAVPYQQVITVLSALQEAGLQRLSFATRSP